MPSSPNILLITSDQHRADALGCAGHPCVRTPHLDALATEGIRFSHAYSDCPVCIPARTTLITGRQAHRYGMPDFAPSYRIEHPRNAFLGSLMTQAGYQTCLLGKSHWHTEKNFRAGFETWVPFSRLVRLQEAFSNGRYGRLSGIGANDFSPALSPFPAELCATDWLADRSIEFLQERDREQPFFLWYSATDPHPPNTIHEPYYSMYDGDKIPDPVLPDWASGDTAPYQLRWHRAGNGHASMTESERKKAHGVYYGKITNLDHQLGRVLGELMAQDVWNETIIIYTSDHGEHLGDYGDYSKGTLLDASARVPLIMRYTPWAEKLGGRRVCDSLVQLADLLPTFCDWAGGAVPSDIDGQSLASICEGTESSVRSLLHGEIGGQHMLHDGVYKYLYFCDDGSELLFDAVSDPRDEHDLSDNRDLTSHYRQQLIKHLLEENNPDLQNGQLKNLGRSTLSPYDKCNITGWIGLKGS